MCILIKCTERCRVVYQRGSSRENEVVGNFQVDVNCYDLEIIRTVQNCKNKTSTDFSDISMSLLKKVISKIVKPFAHICNVSFQTGVFPNKMKIAKVIPLYKSGEKNIFTNYRPISLLPQFSKILEKLYNNRLDK